MRPLTQIAIYALLFVVTVFSFVAAVECQVKQDAIRPQDARAMQALAREFVKQLNEENDVTPVLEKYASSDAPDCLLEELNDDSGVARLSFTPSKVKRFMAPQLNLYYFDATPSGKPREPLVPKDLSSR